MFHFLNVIDGRADISGAINETIAFSQCMLSYQNINNAYDDLGNELTPSEWIESINLKITEDWENLLIQILDYGDVIRQVFKKPDTPISIVEIIFKIINDRGFSFHVTTFLSSILDCENLDIIILFLRFCRNNENLSRDDLYDKYFFLCSMNKNLDIVIEVLSVVDRLDENKIAFFLNGITSYCKNKELVQNNKEKLKKILEILTPYVEEDKIKQLLQLL